MDDRGAAPRVPGLTGRFPGRTARDSTPESHFGGIAAALRPSYPLRPDISQGNAAVGTPGPERGRGVPLPERRLSAPELPPDGCSGRPRPKPPSSLGCPGTASARSFDLLERFPLDIGERLPYLPPPGGARARSFQRAKSENNRGRFPSSTPLRAARKKVLDSEELLGETGNPPLDGTGSLKTEQRRTRGGGRKSGSHGGLRDSFEGLVRRDEPGSTSRWLAGLQ